MHTYKYRRQGWVVALAALLLSFSSTPVLAYIQGLEGDTFNLRAKSDYISIADGSSVFFWGYADEGSRQVQYPGPTLIVTEGVPVTVTLVNNLSEPTSIVFPGQQVVASGGVPGLLTNEAPPDRLTVVTYTFTPTRPGTFSYYSGSHSDLQVEMGLIGALIVRPAGFDSMNPNAYGDARSAYDQEYLFLQSEMDPVIHAQVEFGQIDRVRTTDFWPVLWFLNGRTGPDTMGMNCEPTLPTQPYNSMASITPGQRLLMRVIGGGRDLHPFHTHGNNFEVIARDANLLVSAGNGSRAAEVGTVPDLAVSDFTLKTDPGSTYDGIFTWTGRELGWDFYGHDDVTAVAAPTELYARGTSTGVVLNTDLNVTLNNITGVFPTNHQFRAVISTAADMDLDQPAPTREVVLMTPTGANTFSLLRGQEGSPNLNWNPAPYFTMTDHGKAFPVTLPGTSSILLGATYSGSPFLGAAGFLPPGEGGNNANGGYFYMWHSHNEKEMVNYDIFPGGMMTMMIVEPPGVTIPTMMMGVCP